MTYLEIENQVKQLPPVEQILLAEKMMHWLRKAALPTPDFDRAKATSVAHLIPMLPRVAGLHAGHIWASDDFDAALSDEFWVGQA